MKYEEIMSVVRRVAGCSGKPYPIIHADDPCQPPKLIGESSYYTTPAGTRIRHPNAYKWAKVYQPSTRRITVGQTWLKAAHEFRKGALPEMITDRALEMEGRQ